MQEKYLYLARDTMFYELICKSSPTHNLNNLDYFYVFVLFGFFLKGINVHCSVSNWMKYTKESVEMNAMKVKSLWNVHLLASLVTSISRCDTCLIFVCVFCLLFKRVVRFWVKLNLAIVCIWIFEYFECCFE